MPFRVEIAVSALSAISVEMILSNFLCGGRCGKKMPSAFGDALWWSVSVEIVGYGDIVLVIAEGRWASF